MSQLLSQATKPEPPEADYEPNADSITLVDEGALCGDLPDDVLRYQYRRHRHHLDMRDHKRSAVPVLAFLRRRRWVLNLSR